MASAEQQLANKNGEYVPIPILDQVYSQRSVGPTPFSSEKLPNANCEPSTLVDAVGPGNFDIDGDGEDDKSAFQYRMTYPATLTGVQYGSGPQEVKPFRSEGNFYCTAVTARTLKTNDGTSAIQDPRHHQENASGSLQYGIKTQPAPNPYWQTPPMALHHPMRPGKQEKLPRDTFHPLLSALQASENAKAAGFNPEVAYLSNASRTGPPCEAHLQKDDRAQQQGAGGAGAGGAGDDAGGDLGEDGDMMIGGTGKPGGSKTGGRVSKKGDPKTAMGRAYSSEGGFHEPEDYSGKIIDFAYQQPKTLTQVAAKALASAIHDKTSHSIAAQTAHSRHVRVEPNSKQHGTNSNRYERVGVNDPRNECVPPPAAFRNLSSDLKTVLMKRGVETRHRVAEVLKDKYDPVQPPPHEETEELKHLTHGETHRTTTSETALSKRGPAVDSDEEDDPYALPEDEDTVLGSGSALSIWNLARRRKASRAQAVDEAKLPDSHPAKEVLGNDRRLRVLTPYLISVYNGQSAVAQPDRYLGGVGLRMSDTLAQTKPPSHSSFHRDQVKSKTTIRQFSDIATTPNNSFGFDNSRFKMMLADKGSEIEELMLEGCYHLNESALLDIGNYCPSLKLLDLAGCTALNDATFSHIVSRCNQLAYVNISGCTKLTGESIAVLLESCTDLNVLCMSGLPLLDEGSAMAWTRFYKVPGLSVLDVSFCENLTDECLICVAEHCHGLELLDVSGCSSLGDVGIGSIGCSCTHLIQWRLRLCSQLTDTSFAQLTVAPKNLTLLDLSGCSLSSKTLEDMVQHTQGLQSLFIGGCTQLDDEAVAAVTRYCPSLKYLNLSSCTGINLGSCMLLIHELGRLEKLVVSESTISNAEVVMLSSLRESCKIVRNQYRPVTKPKLVAFKPFEAKKKKPPPKKGK